MAKDKTHEEQARSGRTEVTDPGRTPGQAEGEERPIPASDPKYSGHTPGQAEGEAEFNEDYDYQRQKVRDHLGSNGDGDRRGETWQTPQGQFEKVRSQIEMGMQRFNQSLNDGGTAAQVRDRFQTLASEQGFSADEIKRWLAMIGGGFLAFQGLRRSLGHLSLAGIGAALFYWGYSGESPLALLQGRSKTTHWDAETRIRDGKTMKSMDMSASPRQVTKSIIVKADVKDAFAAWANFENFPQFMQHIKSVHKTGDDYSHWMMEGPLGTHIEWDAKTTRFEQNKRIGWSSVRGDIKTSGQVTFNSLPDNETEVTVTLQYVPPVGMAGEVVAELFGNPEQKLAEDLRNFKRFIEKA